jgi:hypothetical protein
MIAFTISPPSTWTLKVLVGQNIRKVTNRIHNGPQRSNTESPTVSDIQMNNTILNRKKLTGKVPNFAYFSLKHCKNSRLIKAETNYVITDIKYSSVKHNAQSV